MIYSPKTILLFIHATTFSFVSCSAQKSTTLKENNLQSINRDLTVKEENGTSTVRLDAKPGDGMAILENVKFDQGTIRLDVQGEDKPGKSFVGVAFNVKNDSTYESIYFRPFNFRSPEKIRREHSIQYVYHPSHPWNRLREEQEGKFEAAFTEAPTADSWFSVIITVADDKVVVKDGRSEDILMEVPRLAEPSSDKVALWVGNNSRGSFRNLRVEEQ